MTSYTVNGTITMAAWITLDADSEQEALDDAEGTPASYWEYDTGTAEVELNVEPAVER